MPQELQTLIDGITMTAGPWLPRLAGAAAILIVGWFIAWAISSVVRGALNKTGLGGWIGSQLRRGNVSNPPDVSRIVSKLVYYLIMLVVLVATLEVLSLSIITAPLNGLLNAVFAFIPRLIAAGILVLIAWIIASILRTVIRHVLSGFGLDRRLRTSAGEEDDSSQTIANSIAEVVYWFIFLLFLPAILGALALGGILTPVQGMMNEFLAFIPNLIAAAIILIVGWFVAKIVRTIVTNLLAAAGVDSLSEKVGISGAVGGQNLSSLLGLVVYALIFIPIAIAALSALQLNAITAPASNMLNIVLSTIPSIFAAAIILVIAYIVGRLLSTLVASLLSGLGFDTLPSRLAIGGDPQPGERTASQYVGWLVMVATLVFATMQAAEIVGFTLMAQIAAAFITFAGPILFGLILLGIGMFLANLAARAIRATNVTNAGLFAVIARVVILALTGAIALSQMGIANQIIMLAFGLPLAALAIAVAIAFGVGSREIAARELDGFIARLRSGNTD